MGPALAEMERGRRLLRNVAPPQLGPRGVVSLSLVAPAISNRFLS